MGSSDLRIQTESGQIGMPNSVCCVVVEYLPGGALKSFLIKNRRRKLAFRVVVQLALDLARGYNSSLAPVSILHFSIVVWHFNNEMWAVILSSKILRKIMAFVLQFELPSFTEDCS